MIGGVETCVRELGKTLVRSKRCQHLLVRHNSSSSNTPSSLKNSFQQPPLSKPLPGLKKARYATTREEDNYTEVTTLPNGLRVASENRFGQFCTIGVIIESGPRYEVAYPSGISHFLEKIAFHSTVKFKSKDSILHYLEKHGGICDCLASRQFINSCLLVTNSGPKPFLKLKAWEHITKHLPLKFMYAPHHCGIFLWDYKTEKKVQCCSSILILKDTFIYASSADRRGYDSVVNILSEVILQPLVTNQEGLVPPVYKILLPYLPVETVITGSCLSAVGQCFRCKDTIFRPLLDYVECTRPEDGVLTPKMFTDSGQPQASDDSLHRKVDLAAQYITFELENLMSRPEQELLLMDMIHAAAYRDNTLGLPKICPEQNIRAIKRETIMTFMKNHFTPSRMVIAGVGLDHKQLVDSVQKHFGDTKPTWEGMPSKKVDNSLAQYTGGLVVDECKIPQHMGPSGLPELAHVVIGLEGCSHTDPDFIPLCVLSVMMGGGGSFSAGGPGKGMYTRLYTNVLNRYHWMYNATAYNQTYSDSGLFYIHASAPPNNVRSIVDVLTREMATMCGEVDSVELRRAKTQLQSMILMNLESRPVMFEDIARQVLAIGHRKLPATFIQEIENVSKEDIERVATRLLKSQPSVAARGDVKKLPSLSDIQAALTDKEKVPSRRGRLSLFT